ncbi:hypothetical protein IC230_02855 [Spirosoma sp. BT704]|uniref:Secreted repeat protein with Y-X4-D motif n=2 Tax=Spirosoma validum TaxID=2771355 RepID=A0A927AXZ3_9BACT|nr:hypothetical protein [Spirosoma validum]
MKSSTNIRYAVLITSLMAVSLLGCVQDHTVPASNVILASTSIGNVLADENGKTLYVFGRDVAGDANCAGTCRDLWPIYYKEAPSVGTGLKTSDFATITRPDGDKQTTYKGWPLYYYKNDTKAGDVLGDKVGGIWMASKAHYTVMIASRQLVGNDGKNYTFDTKEGVGNSTFLVDSVGLTLYAFAPDKFNVNTYTRPDLSNDPVWPIFVTSATIGDIPSVLSTSDFRTITAVGKTQLTYKGWPMYYFGQDSKQRGATKGVSVPRPGVWPVVNNTSPVAPN